MQGSASPSTVPRWPLLVVLAAAVGARLWSWSWAMQMTNDGADFLWQAQRLLGGELDLMLRHPYHPLTATVIAGVSWITGDVLSAAVTVSVLAGALIVLASHDLARMAFPRLRWAGLGAAVLAALHSRTIIYTSDVQSDGLFLALFLLALRMAFASVQRGVCRRRMAAAGLFAGLAYLTRPEGLFVAVVLGLWALAAWRAAVPSRARVASGVAVFALVLAVVALPYVLIVHRDSGYWGISMKPSVAALGLSDGSKAIKPPSESPISSPIVRRPATLPHVEPPGVEPPAPKPEPKQGSLSPLVWFQDKSPPDEPPPWSDTLALFWDTARADLLVLVAIGFAVLWRNRRGLAGLMLATIAAWLALCAFHLAQSTYLSARHVMVPVELLLPVGGAGLAIAWNAGRARAGLTLALRALIGLSLFAMLWSGVRPRHEDHGPRLEALAWAHEHTAQDERIGVHRIKDGWYAQRRVLVVPTPCDERDLLDKMSRYQVRYLVMDVERAERYMPGWLDGQDLAEVRRFGERGQDGEVVILERPDAGG